MKRSNVIKIVIVVLFALSLITFRMMWNNHFQYEKDQPVATDGVIDFQAWDFTKNEIVMLSGEWDFYPDVLVEDITSSDGKLNSVPIKVPGDWSTKLNGDKDNKNGYGTYYLRIKTAENENKPFKVQVPSIRSASSLYINNEKFGGSGQVGRSKEESLAHNAPYTSYTVWPDENGEIGLYIEASNFVEPRSSGIIRSIKFGLEDAIDREVTLSTILQLMMVIVLLIHALAALIVYFMGIRDKRLLYFSIALIMISILSLMSGDEKLLNQFVYINYTAMLKASSLSGLILFLSIMYILRKAIDQISGNLILFMTFLFLFQIIIVLFSPIIYLEELIVFTGIITSMSLIVSLYALIRSQKSFSNSIWVSLAIVATSSHFFWFIYTMSTGLKVIHYPFDLMIAISCIGVLWFRRYYGLHVESLELTDKLIKYDKTKDDFLTNTSHELRNPLHSILNITDAVLEREKPSLQTESINDLSTVLNVSRRMSFMLDELLDIAAIEDGRPKLDLQPVSIKAIASGVIDMIVYATNEKPVLIKNNIPEDIPLVYADENRVIQVMVNLLHNAIKYTFEGEIEISGSVKGESVYISVSDTGVGMDQETINHIFERYSQGTNADLIGQGGIGIGLYLSQQIIELHHGELTVKSELNKGSTFTFSLPIIKSNKVIEDEQMNQIRYEKLAINNEAIINDFQVTENKRYLNTNRPRIIVVDDEGVNLRVIETILSDDLYDVTCVLTAEEALKLLDEREWDLVISDVMMPKMSGYELTKRIRSRFTISELPVLLITARSNKEDLEVGFLSGANDYITKPVDAIELRARVNALTNARQSMRERLQLEAAWLQAQIKPHFLFNTLNSIIALSRMDIEKMNDVLNAFSDILRAKFKFNNLNDLVLLKEELELVKSYVYIEQTRFGERLEVELNVDEDSHIMIPTLSIQPLIENAINHGAMSTSQGGKVQLQIKAYKHSTEIIVSDNGPGIEKEVLDEILANRVTEKLGVGLMNINLRLKRLYGKGLSIESVPGEGTTVSFKIPK